MVVGERLMIWRWFLALCKWILAFGVIGCLFLIAYWVNGEMRAERVREGDGDKVQSPRRTKNGVVELGIEDADRYGLKDEPARGVHWSERIPVYGQVIPNPKATIEVRAPFAGALRSDSVAEFPEPGESVRSGRVLAWIDVRISPQERLALQDNLNSARLKKEGAATIVELQRERVNRIAKVSVSQIVPGQQLDDARVLLADAETQLAIATTAAELWKKALAEVDRPGGREPTTYSRPLTAPADGEVTEISARPGMAVEAGAPVIQLVDFRRLLVRLNFPPDLLAGGPPARLQMIAIPANASGLSGVSDSLKAPESAPPVEAVLIGIAPEVDSASQFVGYWYLPRGARSSKTSGRIGSNSIADKGEELGAVWRPGLQVMSYATPPSARIQQVVAVAADSVIFHQGRSLVYVRVKPGLYQRREVRLLGRDGDAWVVERRQGSDAFGLAPDEIVVQSGAQVLLSEEFRGDVEAK